MDNQIASALAGFDTLSLDDLNGKAAMLERLDNRYNVPTARLLSAFERFGALFDVLEVGGKRSFVHATQYCDHAGFSYLEAKFECLRDATVRKRL